MNTHVAYVLCSKSCLGTRDSGSIWRNGQLCDSSPTPLASWNRYLVVYVQQLCSGLQSFFSLTKAGLTPVHSAQLAYLGSLRLALLRETSLQKRDSPVMPWSGQATSNCRLSGQRSGKGCSLPRDQNRLPGHPHGEMDPSSCFPAFQIPSEAWDESCGTHACR